LLLLIALASTLAALTAPWLRRTNAQRFVEAANRRLLHAAATGDLPSLATAINRQADLETFDSHLNTALFYALDRRDIAMLDALLAAGANPNKGFGQRAAMPLALAIERNDVDAAARLLKAGATLEPQRIAAFDLWLLHHSGEPMLDLLLSHGLKLDKVLWHTSDPLSEKLRVARTLLERGALADAGTPPGRPMDLAVRSDEPELADLLREFGAPYTAREAATFNRVDEVRQMLDDDPELLSQRFPPIWGGISPENHPTLLGISLSHGHQELSELLMRAGAPLTGREHHGTLMSQAAYGGNADLIRQLAARGLRVNEPNDYPLHVAAWQGHLDAATALIDLGVDIDLQDEVGSTALHIAIRSNHREIIDLLIAADADTSLPDRTGGTAADLEPKLRSLGQNPCMSRSGDAPESARDSRPTAQPSAD
jgi:ankyrin repeat protein